jgi:membrane-associated protease RseP (regulator of RpoE activity)
MSDTFNTPSTPLPATPFPVYRPTVVQRLPQYTPPEQTNQLTAGRVLFHLFLLGLTVLTTTAIGTLLFTADSLARGLASGALFSFTLLTILLTHELGHYIACLWYGVEATLPYFIPSPLPPTGTFGAFIKIKSPIPSRRALFDIGIAGPLAGFVFALPAALVAHYFVEPAPPLSSSEGVIVFNSPPLFVLLERLFHLPNDLALNPVWFAAWIGLFMTSLNLLPVGQLDGGHVVYALFGARWHRLIALTIYLCVLGLGIAAWRNGGWLGWFVYAAILTFLLRIGHPPVMDESEPLGSKRKLVAVLGLLVFLLCFMPNPITL